MTSLDTINLDDYQDLSVEEEKMLLEVGGNVATTSSRSIYSIPSSKNSWYPLIIATTVVFLVFVFNTEWVQTKLVDVPYYKFVLLGLLFGIVLLTCLFLS